ncbi:hypothetical protein [Nocardia asiatica]|uniref:hypothetical protein n=1 Tax=Nocardia asiatica TaxID=209252 RepID=UPI0024539227|nr:hypothetical protein [Nocardia asiatica]
MSIPKPDLPDPRTASSRNPFARRAAAEPEPTEERPRPTAEPVSEPIPTTKRSAPRGATSQSTSEASAQAPDTAEDQLRRNKRLVASKDILLSLPADLKQRMESVLAYTYPHTGIQHQQVFIRNAIAQACAELEERYNNGYQWPPLPKAGSK